MYFLVLLSFVGATFATQPKLLFGRQDYSVSPTGESIDCPDEYICGVYCRFSDYFCCEDGSRKYSSVLYYQGKRREYTAVILDSQMLTLA